MEMWFFELLLDTMSMGCASATTRAKTDVDFNCAIGRALDERVYPSGVMVVDGALGRMERGSGSCANRNAGCVWMMIDGHGHLSLD